MGCRISVCLLCPISSWVNQSWPSRWQGGGRAACCHMRQTGLGAENLVWVPAPAPVTVNLAQGLAGSKQSTAMSLGAAFSAILVLVGGYVFSRRESLPAPPAQLSRSLPWLLPVMLVASLFVEQYAKHTAASELLNFFLLLPNLPLLHIPLACCSLLSALISGVTTKSSLPSLTYCPSGFSSQLLSQS